MGPDSLTETREGVCSCERACTYNLLRQPRVRVLSLCVSVYEYLHE